MTFWRKELRDEPKPTYTYHVFPGGIFDNAVDFDGVVVEFEKPGWHWIIREHNQQRWPRTVKSGTGGTRDAALVEILAAAKEIRSDAHSE